MRRRATLHGAGEGGMRRFGLTVRVLVLVVLLSPAAACVYLPRFDDAVASEAVSPDLPSRLASALGADARNVTRARLVEDPELALASRLDLIDAADVSIDLQYFIWQNDASGVLMVEKLLAAADRGVRIRALLDDIQTGSFVDTLHALDDHPNVEIRIFNPFSVRLRFPLGFIRFAELAIDGNRLNHRMHNKLIVVDNQAAILGGRNIGDDYFGRSAERNFLDTDILLVGPIVPDLSAGFDAYWNSRWVYPVRALGDFFLFPTKLETVRTRIRDRLDEHPELARYRREAAYQETVDLILEAPQTSWAGMIIDDPDVSWFQRPDEIAVDLRRFAAAIEREVLIVTPYLIPTPRLLEITAELIARGVKIRVVTNSLSTNDVVLAHSAYSRFRREILEAGVELYELRMRPALAADDPAEHISLHSKFIVFDEQLVFVGSLNLDPRSLYLNTELGVVLECPSMADALRASFQTLAAPENTWRVLATPDGLVWQAGEDSRTVQPAKSRWQRFRNWVFSLMPLHSQF